VLDALSVIGDASNGRNGIFHDLEGYRADKVVRNFNVVHGIVLQKYNRCGIICNINFFT
jgi:nitrous oxide reductase